MKKQLSLKRLYEEETASNDEGNSYKFNYLEGGYSDGIVIEPNGSNLSLKIKIYGGGEVQKVRLPMSSNLKNLFSSLEDNEDPVNKSVQIEIDNEFSEFKQILNAKLINIFKETDMKVKQAIQTAAHNLKK
jgi:hypothetical protein